MQDIKSNLISIKLDSSQESLVSSLTPIISDLHRGFISRYFTPPKYKGIYIHGPVGRGKTIIINAFIKSLNISCKIFHYQELVKTLHEKIHKLRKHNEEKPIIKFANTLSEKYRVIFIDELEIKDVTDSSVIYRLTNQLLERGVFVVFTSNTEPSALYIDGHQREQVLKLISRIQDSFFVYYLDAEKDYRFSKICSDNKTILYSNSIADKKKFDQMVFALIKSASIKETEIKVFGRSIKLKKTFNNVVYSSLEDLVTEDFSKNEYQEISKKFNAVILNGLNFKFDSSDKVIKFINLIDNIYLNKVLLVAIFEENLGSLYNKSKYLKEYQRAISRVKEIESEEYITKSKYYENEI